MTDIVPLEIKQDVSLKEYNTLGIEARSAYFSTAASVSHIQRLLSYARKQDLSIFTLGGGSNILFAEDYKGLVIHIGIKGIEKTREDDEHVWITIGAGENWHKVVQYCVDKGWGGIENLSLIPGTAGAAPIQNIGAYGVELEEVFESLEAVEINGGTVRTFTNEECRFGYRDSIFKNSLKGKYIIAEMTLRLNKHHQPNTSYGAIQSKLEEKGIDRPTIKDVSDVVIEIRNSKLPNPDDLGNAGSFFKNPIIEKNKFDHLQQKYPDIPGYPSGDKKVKVPAGWLIEKTGWKGKVVGNTGTYKQQALVIVNHGGATGEEILQLAGKIRNSVKEEFGIELVPEVNIIR